MCPFTWWVCFQPTGWAGCVHRLLSQAWNLAHHLATDTLGTCEITQCRNIGSKDKISSSAVPLPASKEEMGQAHQIRPDICSCQTSSDWGCLRLPWPQRSPQSPAAGALPASEDENITDAPWMARNHSSRDFPNRNLSPLMRKPHSRNQDRAQHSYISLHHHGHQVLVTSPLSYWTPLLPAVRADSRTRLKHEQGMQGPGAGACRG